MALLITHDGQKTEIMPQNLETGFTCEELYAFIGAGCSMVEAHGLWHIPQNPRMKKLLEFLGIPDAVTIVMDEEGKLTEQPYNLIGTDVWAAAFDTNNFALNSTGDHVVGNIVLCSPSEFQ